MFVTAPAALAHRPEQGINIGFTEIPDPTTSFAYYRDFENGSSIHFYKVEGIAGQDFHAGINIPQLDGLENYGVTLALFGEGFPSVSGQLPAELAGLDFVTGGGVIADSAVTADFYEPFTQTNYWGRQSLDTTFPATGTYYLVVWQPDELAGKYVLDTGREEVFSPGDLLRFPGWWWSTRSYFNQTPNLWTPAIISLALLAGFVVIRRRQLVPITRSPNS